MPACHVDLDREPEQELREVVVEERSDLHALVLTFLRHPVRQCTKHVLAILEFLVRLLESLATEEHLPGKEKRQDAYRHHPPVLLGFTEDEYLRKDDAEY